MNDADIEMTVREDIARKDYDGELLAKAAKIAADPFQAQQIYIALRVQKLKQQGEQPPPQAPPPVVYESYHTNPEKFQEPTAPDGCMAFVKAFSRCLTIMCAAAIVELCIGINLLTPLAGLLHGIAAILVLIWIYQGPEYKQARVSRQQAPQHQGGFSPLTKIVLAVAVIIGVGALMCYFSYRVYVDLFAEKALNDFKNSGHIPPPTTRHLARSLRHLWKAISGAYGDARAVAPLSCPASTLLPSRIPQIRLALSRSSGSASKQRGCDPLSWRVSQTAP